MDICEKTELALESYSLYHMPDRYILGSICLLRVLDQGVGARLGVRAPVHARGERRQSIGTQYVAEDLLILLKVRAQALLTLLLHLYQLRLARISQLQRLLGRSSRAYSQQAHHI